VPTREALPRFFRDYALLTAQQRALFVVALGHFITDLKAGQGFRPGLRVKRVRGKADIWEMTWAPDGRATWQYGAEVKPGEPHIIWRRIGTHDIFDSP
jgi:hypothetical protein